METFTTYDPEGFYDELIDQEGMPRPGVQLLVDKIESLPKGDLKQRQKEAEALLLKMGITFNVYGQDQGTEKIFPFDLIPRIISDNDWQRIEAGLKQRIFALNEFLQDIYNDKKILKDKVVPKELILSSKTYRKECEGFTPPKKIWCHVTGTDLIRGADGEFYVLEDNLRCPSGVSYVLENRQVLKRTFPHVFAKSKVRPVDEYPGKLLAMLEYLAPIGMENPTIGVLTPGIYNSAYFEHSFLSQQMGVELVEGRDLIASDGYVHMLTTKGLKRIDVLYRRIDDDFIDSAVFRPDSLLGVKGLIDVYKNGRIAMANAPGTGVADDKVVYAYVPKIIKYYTGEDAILPNVPTYICDDDKDRGYVLSHLEELVVKAANESGGYGMLVGPHSTANERETFAELIAQNPRNYIAQPTISLSRVPTIVNNHLEGRHVDLRPYVVFGEDIYVQPGGLTRVALKKGSLVVNSSQGGGSKDTWVLSPTQSYQTQTQTSQSSQSSQGEENNNA